MWVRIAIWALCLAAFVSYAFTVGFFIRHIVDNTPKDELTPKVITPKVSPPASISAGVPVRLHIPSLGVDALIAPAGINSAGDMDIKKSPDDVGWYNLGARPGNVGNAVIAGHYGWDNGKGSVFNDLHRLKPGDEISVTDEKGAGSFFVVRESRSYDPSADATTVFRSNDGKAHLNLITCEGVYSNTSQTYSSRLVVFADQK